jgi:serine/threonine protein kinase
MKIDVALAAASGGSDVEDARAFLQERISLWTFWVFVLSFAFLLTNVVTAPFVDRMAPRFVDSVLHVANLDHLAASLVFAGVWLLTRQVRLSLPTLRAVELSTLIVGCTLFALMGAYLTRLQAGVGVDAAFGAYAGLLACANTVVARAIAVPSMPGRTLIASALALAPLAPATLWASAGSGPLAMNVATWCGVAVAVATVGSRVIFGLRTEAARVRRLGQYTLEEKIGAGGMGVVYRARHALLRRPTAIKLLPPERAGEASLTRFEREVQLTSQLTHPNTVAIYDYGRTPDGVFYYAMEYLDGLNLEELVRVDGPQPAARVIAILDQVCGALSEAHERHLVHRDIKPANIILTERGGEPDVAKVVDFGLVKLVNAGSDVTSSSSNLLTGTPMYMSPEALTTPDSADPRSDLYAVGAVAYYLLTGRPVFDSRTAAETIAAHLQTPPVPPSARAGLRIPEDLERVVLQCLEKDPSKRPGTARELRQRLLAIQVESPWSPADASRWWRGYRDAMSSRRVSSSPERVATVTIDISDRMTMATGAAVST